MKIIIVNKRRFISWIILFIAIILFLLIKLFSSRTNIKTSNANIHTNTHTNIDYKIQNLQENITEPIVVIINENTNSENNEQSSNNTITQNNVNTNSQTNTNNNEIVNQKPNPTGTIPYYIKVNYGAQVVNIYGKDDSGKYTKPVKAMLCSTGTYTPKSGVYTIPQRWDWGTLIGGVYAQYVTVISGDILFHSVPYLRKYDPSSLEYWEYDKLGTKASAGCVRLTVEDARWIYQNCANGTQVEFYSSSNPGPLGKPTAQKISNAKGELKNWDPTDPNESNPWKK